MNELRALPDVPGNDNEQTALLQTTGPGGTSTGMEERVTRLEEWSKVATDRLGRIETKVDALPSKTDMLTMFIATFAVLALVFGGLAWLDGRANRYAQQQSGSTPAVAPAPIIIQLPAPTQQPSKPPA